MSAVQTKRTAHLADNDGMEHASAVTQVTRPDVEGAATSRTEPAAMSPRSPANSQENSQEMERIRGSFFEAGADRLRKLCEATGMGQCTDSILSTFARLLSPWGDKLVGTSPIWASEVGDDHTPYEFSVAFGKSPELRLLVEPLGNVPSLLSNRECALAVIEDLASDHAISTKRLRLIEDLFLPAEPQGLFSLWLGASFWAERAPQLKIYLNPEAQGPALAAALVEEAMVRLGFVRAWPAIASSIARRGRDLDELKYFSLDMAPSGDARVKVYVRHLAATVGELERAASVCSRHRAGDVEQFIGAIAEVTEGSLQGRPPATCLSFIEGRDEPATMTHHFPVNGGYVPDDEQVVQRISAYMVSQGLPADIYQRTVAAIARRPLRDGIGIQSYASFRREGDGMRLTAYYPPELYSPGMIASASPRAHPSTAEEIVERFLRESIVEHPFMRRLSREPVDLHKLWWLMANAEVGIIRDFARRLSQVVAKVGDDRIRSILARQLNDELGGGKFECAHSQLFKKLLSGLEPWRPEVVDEARLGPGREFSKELEDIYYSPNAFEGVGATMLIEIIGLQVDQFIGDQFRRQKEVDPASLEWLTMHEDLEVDHAQESMELAHLVPPEALSSVWRGAERVATATTVLCDGLYDVCFR